MEDFDIIGAFRDYAAANNWDFVFGADNYYRNLLSVQEYEAGKILMIVDARFSPTILNSRITDVNYTCLVSIGRKHDPLGTMSNLDETPIEKYDNRLFELMQLLANTISDIGCQYNLNLIPGTLSWDINLFDTNIDFATGQNIQFVTP